MRFGIGVDGRVGGGEACKARVVAIENQNGNWGGTDCEITTYGETFVGLERDVVPACSHQNPTGMRLVEAASDDKLVRDEPT